MGKVDDYRKPIDKYLQNTDFFGFYISGACVVALQWTACQAHGHHDAALWQLADTSTRLAR